MEKTTMRSYELQMMNFTEYRLHKSLWLYTPPVLILVGTVGNALSFVILTRKSMRKHSTYFYLAVLAVADTFVLYIGLLRLWISELSGRDLIDEEDWSCKLISMLGYTVSDYSVWLIIAVTTERYIVVCHPLKATKLCNLGRAVKVVLGILFLLVATNAHFFWTVQVVYYKAGGEYFLQCAGAEGFVTMVEEVWPWVDAILYSFLPFIVILLLNTVIVRQVIKARRLRHELSSHSSSGAPSSRSGGGGGRPMAESSRLTVMLLTISFAFLLTTLPVNIFMIAARSWSSAGTTLSHLARFKLIRTITEMLMYLNHSMNFFLYCATGQKFRHELVCLLCQRMRYRTYCQSGEHVPWLHSNTTNINALVIRIVDPDMYPFLEDARRKQSTTV